MDNIKVLVADGSPVYRKMFRSAIEEVDKNVSVTCVADGSEAADIIVRKNPDIVIVDVEIPEKDLFELLKLVMADAPDTFVLVTARPSSTSAKVFMEALSAGASDSLTKPIYDSYNDNLETIKIKIAEVIEIQKAGVTLNRKEPVAGKPESGESKTGKAQPGDKAAGDKTSGYKESSVKPNGSTSKTKKTTAADAKPFRPQLILIAASTGGPRALETIIPLLRPDLPVPVLIVQHMPPHFIETLAERLDSKSKLKVKVADNGEKIHGRTVYLAPGGVHMRLSADNEVYLDDSPPINGVRPAADALFESIAEDFAGSRILAIILTGMGNDSMKGIRKLKDKKNCFCIAQSEKTCVVYGMPRTIVESDLADKVLDLESIVPEIESFKYI